MKSFRLFLVSAMSENLSDHSHPPTETSTVSAGFLRFSASRAAKLSPSDGIAGDHAASLDIGKCVVDPGELAGIDLAGRQDAVARKDVGNDRRTGSCVAARASGAAQHTRRPATANRQIFEIGCSLNMRR